LLAEPSGRIHEAELAGNGTGSDSRMLTDLLPGRLPQNHAPPGIERTTRARPPKLRGAKMASTTTDPERRLQAAAPRRGRGVGVAGKLIPVRSHCRLKAALRYGIAWWYGGDAPGIRVPRITGLP
jgi:hypothetical protein